MRKIIITAALLAAANASAGALDSVRDASRQSGEASMTLLNGSVEVLELSGRASANGARAVWNVTEDLAVSGWNISKKSGNLVLTKTRELSRASADSTEQLLDKSGNAIEATLDASGRYVRAVVTQTGELLSASGKTVAKSVKWSGRQIRAGATVLVDASGKVWTESKRVSGLALDASGKAVGFMVDKSGKIVNASADSTLLLVKASARDAKALAKVSGKALKAITYGVGDVSMTIIVTSDVAGRALSTGNLPKSADVLLALPSNLVEAAFGSEFHYRTIQ